jgi:hypothetical protein
MFLIGLMLAATSVASGAAVNEADAAMQRRLALSKQYADLTHRQALTEDVVIRQLKMTWESANLCNDEKCKTLLDEDIRTSVRDAMPAYNSAAVHLIADRLTEGQLKAAVAFVQSPDGQAIMATENAMAEELARIGHDFSKSANDGVYRSFCSQEAAACSRAVAKWTAKTHPQP